MINYHQLDEWAVEDSTQDLWDEFLWDRKDRPCYNRRLKTLDQSQWKEYNLLYLRDQNPRRKQLISRSMKLANKEITNYAIKELVRLGDDLAKDGWKPFAKILWRRANKLEKERNAS